MCESVCARACVSACVCIGVCAYVHARVYVYCVRVCVRMCVYVHAHACVRVRAHVSPLHNYIEKNSHALCHASQQGPPGGYWHTVAPSPATPSRHSGSLFIKIKI